VSEQTLVLRFPEAATDQATRYARSLAEALGDIAPSGTHVNVQRDNPEAMDFGATLVLVLGTTAVTALAQGIKTWLARNSGARIEVLKDGKVIAEHLDSKDAAQIAKVL
jgi:hypothetical protein